MAATLKIHANSCPPPLSKFLTESSTVLNKIANNDSNILHQAKTKTLLFSNPKYSNFKLFSEQNVNWGDVKPHQFHTTGLTVSTKTLRLSKSNRRKKYLSLSVCLSVCLSVSLCVSFSLLSVCVSLYLYIYIYIYIYIYVCIHAYSLCIV